MTKHSSVTIHHLIIILPLVHLNDMRNDSHSYLMMIIASDGKKYMYVIIPLRDDNSTALGILAWLSSSLLTIVLFLTFLLFKDFWCFREQTFYRTADNHCQWHRKTMYLIQQLITWLHLQTRSFCLYITGSGREREEREGEKSLMFLCIL